MPEKVVIVGAGETAELAYEYLTYDSPYEVVAFSVERQFLGEPERLGLPVVAFEELERHYPPDRFRGFVALSYTQLNRPRARLFRALKGKGYSAISYVSSKATVWHSVRIGENCLIQEHNVLQHGVEIGDDVILWAGNHIGHRSRIGDHCFISSQSVISGYVTVGESCFFGVNTTIGNNIEIGRDCIIGAGAVVLKGAEPGLVYRGNPATPASVGSLKMFGVRDEEQA